MIGWPQPGVDVLTPGRQPGGLGVRGRGEGTSGPRLSPGVRGRTAASDTAFFLSSSPQRPRTYRRRWMKGSSKRPCSYGEGDCSEGHWSWGRVLAVGPLRRPVTLCSAHVCEKSAGRARVTVRGNGLSVSSGWRCRGGCQNLTALR